MSHTRKIPLYPYFAGGLHATRNEQNSCMTAGVFDNGKVLWTFNARSALEIGLQSMQLQRGDEILVPAYHCPVMIYPIIEAGLVPIYFRIQKDCSIDFDDLQKKLSSRSKAIIAVHYFGFPAQMTRLRSLCDIHGLFLVEDCAHAFFGKWKETSVGTVGDIAIASLYKFFPVYDGGGIRFNHPDLAANVTELPSPKFILQLKSMLNTLEARSNPNRKYSTLRGLFTLKSWVMDKIKRQRQQVEDAGKRTVEENADSPFTPEIIGVTYSRFEMPLFSSLIYRVSKRDELIRRRRDNYQYLSNKLTELGYELLFPSLPDDVVPYNLPVVSEQIGDTVSLLRSHDISIARFGEYYWDENNRGLCSFSDYLSKYCFQIPIHQSLDTADLDYIVDLLITARTSIHTNS